MKQSRIAAMTVIIAGYQELSGLSNEKVAKKIGVSRNTFAKYKATPEEMPMKHWWKICDVLEVPEADRIRAS
jgi:transposase